MPSMPLLERPVSFPCMHAGVLVGPGRERWGIERHRRHGLSDPWSGQVPHLWDGCRARMPGHLIRRTKRLPIAPRTRWGAHAAAGICPLPGLVLLEHRPSFTNPTTRRGHQIHSLFWTLISPLDTLFLLFLLNKSLSEAWRHTPTVSVVCSSHHNIYSILLY